MYISDYGPTHIPFESRHYISLVYIAGILLSHTWGEGVFLVILGMVLYEPFRYHSFKNIILWRTFFVIYSFILIVTSIFEALSILK